MGAKKVSEYPSSSDSHTLLARSKQPGDQRMNFDITMQNTDGLSHKPLLEKLSQISTVTLLTHQLRLIYTLGD